MIDSSIPLLLCLLTILLIQVVQGGISSIADSPASLYQFNPATQETVSLRQGLLNAVLTKWNNAQNLAQLEQAVEDYNAAEIIAPASNIATMTRSRRLIVLPLDQRFDPPVGVFSHGHVQTGDKMSLPNNFWTSIQANKAEVPWLFEVKRVKGVTSPRAQFAGRVQTAMNPNGILGQDPLLERVVGGALDFRSPPNYVFLPLWMMRALALKPMDVVDVSLIETVPPGSLVQLRPHSSEFTKIANPQAVLETELKHYSSLTRGATIAFDYSGKRYWFDVVDLRSAPRGEKVPMVKVQDCDVVTEFLRAKDQLKTKKEGK